MMVLRVPNLHCLAEEEAKTSWQNRKLQSNTMCACLGASETDSRLKKWLHGGRDGLWSDLQGGKAQVVLHFQAFSVSVLGKVRGL